MRDLKRTNIKKHDFIKKADSIFLVKDFRKRGSKLVLEYFFKTTKRSTGILHGPDSREFYESQTEHIKKASKDEIETLISKIKNQHPQFDLSNIKESIEKNSNSMSEESCIQYLEDRGYLVYQQI